MKIRNMIKNIVNEKFLKKFGYKIQKLNQEKNIKEITRYENLLIEKCLKYSMTNKIRMWSLLNSINYVSHKNIPGDFVECGVWRGGNLILFQLLNIKKNLNRKIYAYDTFEGMPLPSKHDGAKALNEYNKKNTWCASTLNEVKNNILKNCSIDNIKFIKGKVEETLQINQNIPDKISILRLDTDFYESTKIELEMLYPRLVKNGVLIIDDYGYWKGSKKAVDEYFSSKAFLIYVDNSCRILIKN